MDHSGMNLASFVLHTIEVIYLWLCKGIKIRHSTYV